MSRSNLKRARPLQLGRYLCPNQVSTCTTAAHCVTSYLWHTAVADHGRRQRHRVRLGRVRPSDSPEIQSGTVASVDYVASARRHNHRPTCNAVHHPGQRTNFKLGQTVFPTTILKHHESKNSTYQVKFDSNRHKRGKMPWVDLELPGKVSAGEYSYWKLDGYDTNVEESESDLSLSSRKRKTIIFFLFFLFTNNTSVYGKLVTVNKHSFIPC